MSLLNVEKTPMRYNNLGGTGLMVSELSETPLGPLRFTTPPTTTHPAAADPAAAAAAARQASGR